MDWLLVWIATCPSVMGNYRVDDGTMRDNMKNYMKNVFRFLIGRNMSLRDMFQIEFFVSCFALVGLIIFILLLIYGITS